MLKLKVLGLITILLLPSFFAVSTVQQSPLFFPPIHGKPQPRGEYVNPFLYYTSPPAPSGIASFGLYNYSGKVTPYVIETSKVLGYANITSLLAYYKQARKYSVNPYSATLQMNVVLQVNTTQGTFAYWLQDVGSFQTNKNQVTFIDNIWNLTGNPSTLSSSAVSGNGKVASAGSGNTFYYDVGPTFTYSFPFSYVYVVNTSYTSNSVSIWFGYEIIQGSQVTSVQYYDKVTISQPGIKSAEITINGNTYTPDGLYYDAELVWGGGGNGAPTQFTHLNSSLGLYYLSSTGVTPIPSLYTFGSNTGESTYNVHDNLVNGVPESYVGTEELMILTNNFSVVLV
ncbi:thermopsin [Metallosphaera sedula]|uniref:thermopsin n=1 Tax=Metallosphaera prunae TaxID=47304 RepID=UPI0023EF9AFF|nr:thermopsin [Metallosphaera prunae]